MNPHFHKFMTLLATRLHALFEHNEAKLFHIGHFFARLVTESIGRFHYQKGDTYGNKVFTEVAPVGWTACGRS